MFAVGGGGTQKCNDLISVLLRSDGKGGIVRDYVDTVPRKGDEDANNDFFYFKTWLQDITERKFKPLGVTTMLLWSDGGRKHFKQRFSLAEFSFVRYRNPWLKHASWNFWPSYHGKSLCDSHAGKIAQAVAYAAFHDDFIWQTNESLQANF
eukprot:gb/GEZN01009004.1/.p1 GENE.gb/GEZN01009004.1/~~gb/GEZN01009004.1/.p1  ORF type:complete len:151 (-),score=0.53 gb/GEZN01009004.1/:171-623(-)